MIQIFSSIYLNVGWSWLLKKMIGMIWMSLVPCMISDIHTSLITSVCGNPSSWSYSKLILLGRRYFYDNVKVKFFHIYQYRPLEIPKINVKTTPLLSFLASSGHLLNHCLWFITFFLNTIASLFSNLTHLLYQCLPFTCYQLYTL